VTANGGRRALTSVKDVTVIHDAASTNAAKAFVADPRPAEAMKRLGVDGEPEIWLVEDA